TQPLIKLTSKLCFLTLCWFCSAASVHVYSIAKHTDPIGTKDLSSLPLFPDCAQDSWSPVRLKAFVGSEYLISNTSPTESPSFLLQPRS
ncbi:hypothetical protein C8J57DRAFT_1324304, partial [Mycena rebaudengoi]